MIVMYCSKYNRRNLAMNQVNIQYFTLTIILRFIKFLVDRMSENE